MGRKGLTDDPASVHVSPEDRPPGGEEQHSRVIYIREPRERPELATAVLALIVAFVAGVILGGSGVLIWDNNKHSDACSQLGPRVVWDQDAYRCVRVPLR